MLGLVAVTTTSPRALAHVAGASPGDGELLGALEHARSHPSGNALALWYRRAGPESVRGILDLLSDRSASLSAQDRDQLLGLLEGQDESVLLAQFAPRSEAWSPQVVLLALGRFGGSQSVPLALDELARIPARQLRSRQRNREVAEALAAVLRRDPDGFVRVHRGAARLPQAGFKVLARACSRTGRPEAISVIESLLEASRPPDLEVLASLENLRVPREGFGERVANLARGFLGDRDARVRRVALRVIQVSGDRYAVDDLIEGLSDRDRGVQAAAASALRDLAGRDVAGSDAEKWRRWYESELDWWTLNEGELQEALGGGRAVAALRSLRGHGALRDRVTRMLLIALDHSDPSVVVLACRQLAEVGLAIAAPQLCRCLDIGDEAVHDAALEALREVTGQALSRDIEAWWRWMGI